MTLMMEYLGLNLCFNIEDMFRGLPSVYVSHRCCYLCYSGLARWWKFMDIRHGPNKPN